MKRNTEMKPNNMYMNIKQHIQTLVLTALLLLAGGMMGEAATVTYHILTKPFNVRNAANTAYLYNEGFDVTGKDYSKGIRVEALRCTSSETTIGLPSNFKSPLAKNFQYYTSATYTFRFLYDYGNESRLLPVKYNVYTAVSGSISEGDPVGANTDIYVTYDYINDGELASFTNGIYELDGSKKYNIPLNSGNKLRYLCFNKDRNNRPGATLASTVSATDLVSNDFVTNTGGGLNKTTVPIHLQFKFLGEDPYNITIMTAYEGDDTYTEALGSAIDGGVKMKKTYSGSSIFAKLSSNANNNGTANMWLSPDDNKHYKNTTEVEYDRWEGFYRKDMNPIFNAVALLPHSGSGYVFVASKLNQGPDAKATSETVYQPNSSGNYACLTDDGNNPRMIFKALGSAVKSEEVYEIKTFTYKVKTHYSKTTFTADIEFSDAEVSEPLLSYIPEKLKRKYVNFTGAYSDESLTNAVTTFKDVEDANNGNVIWLDYAVSESLPFDTLAATSGTYNYQNARWYTMRMNGKTEARYIAYDNGSNNLITTDGSGNAKGSNVEANLHTGENSAVVQVAFVGDPYELKIISRAASETASATRYIGCATDATNNTTLNTNKTGSSDISTWEIVYENADFGNFVLRQFNTYDDPKYIGWADGSANKPVVYSTADYTNKNRIRVVELDKKRYAYHVMRIDGSIAVKAIVSQDVGTILRNWRDVPEIIRSPYLSTATVNFYDTPEKATANNPATKITNTPYDADGVTEGVYANVYIRYTYASSPGNGTFNVRLNSEYIYTDENDPILSKSGITSEEAATNPFQWLLNYDDPYAMTIQNLGKDNKYIKVASWGNNVALDWDTNSANASLFIAKSGAVAGTYEVMAATGDGVDASTTYYNIGRPSANTVKLYSNASYLSGNQTLRFQLVGTSAHDVTYHLIDKAGKDLLQAVARHTTTDNPAFPPEYNSPLVSSYQYYLLSDFTVSGDKYTLDGTPSQVAAIGSNTDIYVTYNVNNLVNLQRGQLYLLKYEAGENFRQEDGGDKLLPYVADMSTNTYRYKAVYPYVNGDCNFFVYGQEQYDIQQQGAASTRTRWAWYVQSDLGEKGDPYHVKIRSRQSESYPITDSKEYNAFFATYKPSGYDKAVTTLVWPGISGETATDYMVLGREGQYQLMTSYKVDMNGDGVGDERKVVNSFDQYWKTFDTIRKNIYGDSKASAKDEDPWTIPNDTPSKFGSTTYTMTLRDSLTNVLGWHNYEKWAYAKRWNGYNNGYSSTEGKHETKKGWEEIEHWYQTINMGEGYFDFVKTSIDPVLILLDQHGWEIMRKPIPTSDDDPERDAKLEAIRPYNSPMIKEYAYWATTKKRTGFHQYYLLSDRMGDGKGGDHTSTDLTDLPSFNGKNVHDKKGNLNDQYVTYIVKDEYAQTYNPADKTAKPFLIEQGTKYSSTLDGTTIIKNGVPAKGMLDYITNTADIPDAVKWYVKPNWNIDYEMGYGDTGHSWAAKNPNAYEDARYKNLRTAKYISNKDSLGYFSFSNGFDPYNIQIMPISYSASSNRKFMKTNATGMNLDDGIMHGVYSEAKTISLYDSIPVVNKDNSVWFDSRKLSITNTTFMAVQDAEGNMQLMPRFDQDVRMSEFGTLIAPTDADVAKTYTKLYRPEVYEYLIIDNDGKESLRYKSGGDLLPQTPNHLKSPLATNFTYYKNLVLTDGVYNEIKNKTDISSKLIDSSLDGAEPTDNIVYVRYDYNEEADALAMLYGKWLTMQIDGKDAKYDSGIKQGAEKPATINDSQRTWQWKLIDNRHSTPDPYAVYLFNRSLSAGTTAIADRFALLSHTTGDYALAKAGRGDYTYQFLNGSEMSTISAAEIMTEEGFTCTEGIFSGTDSQVILTDEVDHTFTYKVFTNGGVNAIDATQTLSEVTSNEWQPELPESARTPLLNLDQYRYYEQNLTGTIAENDTLSKGLSLLYGLYDDIVYTHYTPYSSNESSYFVPNVRNATNVNPVARGAGSNDAPISLDGNRPYNIIWYDDNMMKSSNTSISYENDQELKSGVAYEWEFEGDDPYAIKIKSGNDTYIHEATSETTDLNETPTTFMLLNKDNYDYGVFTKTGTAVTGATPVMLSGYGQSLTTSDPTKFIIFALSTYKVIYHLMIKNIGEDVIIPYRETNEDAVLPTKIKAGTTMRDLKTRNGNAGTHIDGDEYQLGGSLPAIIKLIDVGITTGLVQRDSIYCVDAGHVSLGAAFDVPKEFYRPNVTYDFYIEGIYADDGTGGTGDLAEDIIALNDEYKGLKMTNMGEDSKLLGKIVFVNIVYNFMGGLLTNSGDDFVTNVNQNKWYTFETNGATPYRAHYTATAGLKTESASNIQYTNDFLWTPVGDPYGFKMYNRYIHKNLGEAKVMCTADISAGRAIEMTDDVVDPIYNPANSVYELLATNSTTPGYFNVHPLVNKVGSGLQYYINNNPETGAMTLSTTPTEWAFGLSEEMLEPYYNAAGYVGGLTAAGKTAYENAEGEGMGKLMNLQKIVYNTNNIVPYSAGYYRIHSQPNAGGLTTPRYASGYTHKTELTPAAIPMHFYEQTEYDIDNPVYGDLGTPGTDFTETPATRGEVPITTVDEDPASIFQFTGTASAAKMSTQGLYVIGNSTTNAAEMTEAAGSATTFKIEDIGGATMLIYTQPGAIGTRTYLNWDQTSKKYDLKYSVPTPVYDRWCIQPVQKSTKAGAGEMALRVRTHDDGNAIRYTTFYAPFDVLLTNATTDMAYIVPTGKLTPPLTADTQYTIHPKRMGDEGVNTAPYAGNSQFIPAGTPVIIRTRATSGYVTLALPTTTPSTPISSVFTGQYLEQMLDQGSDYVFVFGRPSSGTFTEDASFSTNGLITVSAPASDRGVGFYKNANLNRESSKDAAAWTRNNKYVYGNKIYYRAAVSSGGDDALDIAFEESDFIPVIFDEDELELQENGNGYGATFGDGRVYDMQGRCVVTEQEAIDGSWINTVAPGMYIVNGKKFVIE